MLTDPRFQMTMLTQGFPGRSLCHGGLGWSTVAVIQQQNRTILVDTGSFNARHSICSGLQRLGVSPTDVTDVLLTHAHYDHSLNWVLFPNARIHIGKAEMDWATLYAPGDHLIPELYIQALQNSRQLALIRGEREFLPGMQAIRCPGHTPGSLVFLLTGKEHSVIFTGDAAKNRAELLSRRADMTMDENASLQSISRVWSLWKARPETLLVPGHDLPMRLVGDRPEFVGARAAGVSAWFHEDLKKTTIYDFAADS